MCIILCPYKDLLGLDFRKPEEEMHSLLEVFHNAELGLQDSLRHI